MARFQWNRYPHGKYHRPVQSCAELTAGFLRARATTDGLIAGRRLASDLTVAIAPENIIVKPPPLWNMVLRSGHMEINA